MWRNHATGLSEAPVQDEQRWAHGFKVQTQIDMVVCGWACAHVLRFGAAPVGMHYPMIRMAGGVCKDVAQELSDDRMA